MEEKRRQLIIGLTMLDQEDPAPRFSMGYYYSKVKDADVIPLQSIFAKQDVKQSLDNLLTLFGKYAAEFGLQYVNTVKSSTPSSSR